MVIICEKCHKRTREKIRLGMCLPCYQKQRYLSLKRPCQRCGKDMPRCSKALKCRRCYFLEARGDCSWDSKEGEEFPLPEPTETLPATEEKDTGTVSESHETGGTVPSRRRN